MIGTQNIFSTGISYFEMKAKPNSRSLHMLLLDNSYVLSMLPYTKRVAGIRTDQ